MNINGAIAIRLSLLVSLAVVLSAASSRLHADVQDTGTCGGVTVTLPFTVSSSARLLKHTPQG